MESKTLKVVFVGDSHVGKTSIIHKMAVSDNFDIDTIKNTIGSATYQIIREYENKNHIIEIWDTAGQEIYQSMVPSYSKNSVLALIVFDLTKDITFANVESWANMLKNASGLNRFIIVGNKCDLENKTVKIEDVQELCQSLSCEFIFVSAKNGQGIDILTNMISHLAFQSLINNETEVISSKTLNLKDTQQTQNKCCWF